MPVFLWCVRVCENLVEVVFFKKFPDELSSKLRSVVISYFHMNASVKQISWLKMVYNDLFPGFLTWADFIQKPACQWSTNLANVSIMVKM